jgi:hypothetical protein
MLQSISWSDYFSTLAFLLLVYYLFVFYTYFKWDILKKIGITKVDNTNLDASQFKQVSVPHGGSSRREHAIQAGEMDLTPIIEIYINEVKAFLEEAAENRIVKEEILFALQQISAKYEVVYKADTRNGILQEVYCLVIHQFPNLVTVDELRPYLFS